jgi:hypothetical protein
MLFAAEGIVVSMLASDAPQAVMDKMNIINKIYCISQSPIN